MGVIQPGTEAGYCPAMATQDMSARLARMGYGRARLMLSLVGLAILAVLVVVLLVRSVDTTEVIATLLFAPIFLLLLWFGLPGGLIGAAAATGIYVVLRADAIDAVGWGEFSALIVTRAIAYFLFGTVGGWASGTLSMSLDKLDLYDQIDDLTGVNNARFLLTDIDLERARSERYQTVFSVSFLSIDAGPISDLPGRKRKALLRELGSKLEDGIRTMDRVAHGYDGSRHRVATILPETAGEGARVFQARLEEQMRTFLAERGAGGASVSGEIVTLPGDDAGLDRHLAEWRSIDAAEHSAPRT
jgi:GGDEF domain-containing protein